MPVSVKVPADLHTKDDIDSATIGSVARSDLLSIVEQRGPWTRAVVQSIGEPDRDGWIISKLIEPNYEPTIIEEIDRAKFAASCLGAARFFGSNVHLLLAWAELASQIKNDKVDTEDADWKFFGPFRFSRFTWGRYRNAKEFGSDFGYGDLQLHDPPCQCDVAAIISSRALTELEAKLGPGKVDAKTVAFAVLLGTPAALQGLDTPDAKLDDLITKSYPTDTQMLKEVRLRTKLLEKIAGNSLADKTVTQALGAIATALDACLAKTKQLILDLDPDEFPLVADASLGSGGPDVLMAATPEGTQEVYGHLVKRLKETLNKTGANPPLSGMKFDAATIEALNKWRQSKNKPASNAVTVDQWTELTGLPKPEMFDRCAQITASFEGHGFGDVVAGNADGAILTWGYNGFTFIWQHVQNILERIEKADAAILNDAFDAADANGLRQMLALKTLDAQRKWGRENFLKGDGKTLKENWETGFKKLGTDPRVESTQLEYSRSELWPAAKKMATKLGFGEDDPLSWALCFDIHIQNGRTADSFKSLTFPADASEVEKRQMLVKALLKSMDDGTFKEDVEMRKMTLANGKGTVHGRKYDLSVWGLFPADNEADDEQDDQTADEPAANGSFESYFKSELGDITAFAAREFLVKGSNTSKLNRDPPKDKWRNVVPLVRLLQKFADTYAQGSKVKLNSVYRDPAYNATLKGAAKKSQHMQFRAADVRVPSKDGPKEWARIFRKLRKEGVFKGGIGTYPTFVHVDVRGWDANWG